MIWNSPMEKKIIIIKGRERGRQAEGREKAKGGR